MNVLKSIIAFTFALLLLVVRITGQEAGIQGLLGHETQPVVTSNISSTPTGGPWSSPSTWAGGTVPTAADDVTILGGATVVIDTAAAAKSVTVGGTGSRTEAKVFSVAGGAPAVLKFGETAGFSLTVTNNVTIGANDTLSSGGGNANAHVLTIGGDLTNDGVFDLSTNNNQAGALLVFTGNSSNTFGGTGPVNDVMWMTVNKGNSITNILEITLSNFTVQGNTSDGSASAFLSLIHGVLKISGTFTGAHRTFIDTPYEIAAGAGLWLNNPNYTIVAQHQPEVAVFGLLRVTAGTYNVGTDLDDSLAYYQGGNILMEGGYLNVAGVLRSAADGSIAASYTQTGGVATVCTVGHSIVGFACFDRGPYYILNSDSLLIGGELAIQNAPQQDCCLDAYYGSSGSSNAIVRLGNAFSNGPGVFRVNGGTPNLVIDTTAGAHKVWAPVETDTVEIGPGARFIIRNGSNGLRIRGNSFINNGILSSQADNSPLWFFGQNPVYSGSGVCDGPIRLLQLWGETFTLNSVNNLRVREVEFRSARMINSNKLTLGNNDAIESIVYIRPEAPLTAGFDTAPVFELGTGGQTIFYGKGPWTTGVEVNPERRLKRVFSDTTNSSLTIAGGDLDVGQFVFSDGAVFAGPYKIRADAADIYHNGYLVGTLILKLTAAPRSYLLPVGENGYSPITLDVSALGTNPSYVAVSAVDSTLPGLLPARSTSRHWKVEEIGDITAGMRFRFMQADIRGVPGDYKAWHSTGGTPSPIAGSFYDSSYITVVTPGGITDFTGNWGVGAQLDPGPVSISGSVTTSGGQPIRNATMTITGGNLPGPVVVQTGNFGTYGFTNLQAGEAYTIRVDVKRYRFAQATQVITPMNNVGNVNFVANP